MVLCEDGECSVCLFPYSRSERIPRVLHCRHTFCDVCLETMSQSRSDLLTVACPLCRRVTCIDQGRSLQEVLWVNSELWDQIPEDMDAETEQHEDKEKAEENMEAKQPSSPQAECPSTARAKLRLPAFFRKFSLTKQHEQSIVPRSDVEMKSWRRLSTDETF